MICRSGTRERFDESQSRKPDGFRYVRRRDPAICRSGTASLGSAREIHHAAQRKGAAPGRQRVCGDRRCQKGQVARS